MQTRIAGLLVLAMFACGCNETYSPVPEGVRKPPAKVEVVDCPRGSSSNPAGFVRIIGILDRNGDVGRANAFYTRMRRDIDTRLAKQDPAAPGGAKPALDALFSGAELKKRAACEFNQYQQQTALVDAWDTWSNDEVMRGIHNRVVDIGSHTPVPVAPVDGLRRELLRRVVAATALQSLVSTVSSAQRQAAAVVEDTLDPTSSLQQDIALNGAFVRPPEEDAIIDRYLASSLAEVTDADLQRFLAFAEAQPGQVYYQALALSYSYTLTDWYERLAAVLKNSVKPAAIARDPEAAAPMVAEARRLYDEVGTRVVVAEARALLLKAERLDPDNAEIQALLGRIALVSVPDGHFREEGQIRDEVSQTRPPQPERYAEAEAYLRKAIELDPQNAEAHLYLGHAKFLQSEDAEAARFYAAARRLKANPSTLALFEAGLAHVAKDYAKAERHYRQVLAQPEGRAFNYYFALTRLRLVLTTLGREREFRDIAKSQLRRQPDMWDFRLDYADRLLATDGSAAEVLALVEPVPDQWLRERKQDVLVGAELLKVADARPADRIAAAKRVFAISGNPGRVAALACASRRHAEVVDAILRASDQPARVAMTMIACGLWQHRPDAVAAAVPFAERLDQPNSELRGETALCVAASQREPKSMEILLKAKLDPALPCGGDGKTPRQRLVDWPVKNDPDVRATLAAMDRNSSGTKP